jgi:hypothetical protein
VRVIALGGSGLCAGDYIITGALLILCAILSIGTAFESKIPGVLFVIIGASFLNFYVGMCIPTNQTQNAKGAAGATGLSAMSNVSHQFVTHLFAASLLTTNFGPESSVAIGTMLIYIFSVYFPSGTGFMAGANISGDLKDPAASIPLFVGSLPQIYF